MCPFTDFKSVISCAVAFLVQKIVPILIGIALIVFLWGVFRFIRSSGEETAREEGKQFMFWGLVGLFVMVSVWALVGVLSASLGGGGIYIPQVSLTGL